MTRNYVIDKYKTINFRQFPMSVRAVPPNISGDKSSVSAWKPTGLQLAG
jgi:hypothetical protein